MAVLTRAAAEIGGRFRACYCHSRFYTFAELDPNECLCMCVILLKAWREWKLTLADKQRQRKKDKQGGENNTLISITKETKRMSLPLT